MWGEMAGIYAHDKYKSNIELLYTCNLTLSSCMMVLSTTCSASFSWTAFCNDFGWASAVRGITMMIFWLLWKDFKPPSRQVKAAGNIRVCLWSLQGVRSIHPQTFDHILENRKLFFNWLISNGEVDWAGGWFTSATAKPGENLCSTLRLMGYSGWWMPSHSTAGT